MDKFADAVREEEDKAILETYSSSASYGFRPPPLKFGEPVALTERARRMTTAPMTQKERLNCELICDQYVAGYINRDKFYADLWSAVWRMGFENTEAQLQYQQFIQSGEKRRASKQVDYGNFFAGSGRQIPRLEPTFTPPPNYGYESVKVDFQKAYGINPLDKPRVNEALKEAVYRFDIPSVYQDPKALGLPAKPPMAPPATKKRKIALTDEELEAQEAKQKEFDPVRTRDMLVTRLKAIKRDVEQYQVADKRQAEWMLAVLQTLLERHGYV